MDLKIEKKNLIESSIKTQQYTKEMIKEKQNSN
jgi:hypothetical protein